MRHILFATAAAVALAASGAAQAQQQAGSEVSELVITRGLEESLPEELAKSGVRVDVVTTEQIRQGGFLDINFALQALAPGLTIIPRSGPFDYGDISLLGGRTQDTLFLIDGVRINNRLYASTPPLDTVPASMVERIEVLQGGQALFYGTQGVAGAVNIVTRPFTEEARGAITLGGGLMQGQDNAGAFHGDAFFSNKIGRSQFVVYASGDKSRGVNSFRPVDYQPSAADRDRSYQVITGGAKYALAFSDQTRLSLAYQHSDAKLDDPSYRRVVRQSNDRREDLATLKLDHDLSDNVSLYLKGYYHRWKTQYASYTRTSGTGPVTGSTDPWGYDDAGANAFARLQLTPGLEYFVGYDYQRYGGSDAVLVIRPNKGSTNAVFAQVRTTHDMIENGVLAAGVRYSAPDSGQDATIWNASGEYNFGAGFYVRGTLGTNFRLPTAEELFADAPNEEVGNLNLKPEQSSSVNLSFGGKTGPVNWELTGFARNISNLIDYADDPVDDPADPDSIDQYPFINRAEKIEVRGAEFNLSAQLTPDLKLAGSYTHSKSEGKGTGLQINRIPVDAAKALLDWTPAGSPFGLQVSANWTGDIYTTTSANGRVNYGGFTLVNAGMHYDFESSLRLNVSLENIFDEEYGRPVSATSDAGVSYTAYPVGLPRTLRATLTKSF